MKILKLLFVLLLGMQCAVVLSQAQDASKLTYQMVQGHQGSGPADVFETCPPTSFFGQNPVLPDGPWAAYTSDANLGPYLCYENFSGLTQAIGVVHFWGLNLHFADGWFECNNENPMSFEIKFYQDNAGFPGALVATFNMSLTGDNTGLIYVYGPLYHYKAQLNSSVNLAKGWISIQGTSVGDPDCAFLWMNSQSGDALAYQQTLTGELSNLGTDLSLCFEGGMVPLSNWALILGAVLIGVFVFIRYRKLS